MKWINDFSKSASSLFRGQVLEGFQPIDFYHFFPLWYDLWIAKIAELIKKLDLEHAHYSKIRAELPPPSNIRSFLIKVILSYYANPVQNKYQYKIVTDFFVRMLMESCQKDPFGLKSNPLHTDIEISKLINGIKWENADITSARAIGQLITSVGSYVHGLYNDVGTDYGWDVYGPYYLEFNKVLLIRHFTNLCPVELWPKKFLGDIKQIYIYTTYENVDWQISFVGCHTLSQGESPVNGMRKFAVFADDKTLSTKLIGTKVNEFSTKAENIYKKIRSLNMEDLKLLVMKQECYQLNLLFDKACIDWRPDDSMKSRIINKPLLHNIFPYGKLIKSTKEFEQIFGISKFDKEILN